MRSRLVSRFAEKKTLLLFKKPLVELTGLNRVLIENHMGVIAYSLEEIQVKVEYGRLVVNGEKLRLIQLNAEQLVIFGRIGSIRPMEDGQ